LGRVDTRLISAENPFGLHSGNPYGQDDVLVQSSELHLPLGKPVKVLLRSKDVVHDFYVPYFRVRMDAMPGMITHFWFTPTHAGTFEIACTEYCGLGHHVMRGQVVVEEEGAFQAWLNAQPTFAQSGKEGKATGDKLVEQGRK
jgi:cytochrome c oxidase subunit 2